MAREDSKDTTLHKKILRDIEGRIVSGEWPPGFKLPFELDLAVRYDCSRMTVNKVMTQLAQSGLIERRKRAGSFVTQPRAQSAVLEIHDIETEVRSLSLSYSFTLQRRRERKAIAADRRVLGVEAGTRLIDICGTHFAGSAAFCVEERLINATAVPEAAEMDFAITPPGQWLLRQVPWTTAEHRIQAVGADVEMARMLGIARNTACLVIERRTWSNLGPITRVRFTYPGDRHTMIARFTPSTSRSF